VKVLMFLVGLLAGIAIGTFAISIYWKSLTEIYIDRLTMCERIAVEEMFSPKQCAGLCKWTMKQVGCRW
jgi:hypothetical protein